MLDWWPTSDRKRREMGVRGRGGAGLVWSGHRIRRECRTLTYDQSRVKLAKLWGRVGHVGYVGVKGEGRAL
jgi:hypothetical protein